MTHAMKLVYQLSLFISLLILCTGGLVLKLPFGKLELNRIEVFGVILLLSGIFLMRKGFNLPNGEKLFQIASQYRIALTVFITSGLVLWLTHLFRHWGLATNAYDTTFLHQSLKHWNGLPFLHCDLCIGASYLGEHASMSLAILGPLVQFLGADEWIFSLQFICLFLPPLLLITQGPLKQEKNLWIFPIVALLSFRAFRNSMIWDFREDDLAFAFTCLSLLALYLGRAFWYFLFLFGALLCKENVGFISLGFGVSLFKLNWFHIKNRKQIASATIALSFAYLLVAWGYLLPHFTAQAPGVSNFVQRFPGMGSTTGEVLRSILTSPKAWWQITKLVFFHGTSFKYIFICLLPFAFFLRFARPLLIPIGIGILANLASSAPTQHSLQFHYELVFLPYLLFGLLYGVKKWSTELASIEKRPYAWFLPLVIPLVAFGKSPVWEMRSQLPSKAQFESSYFLRAFQTEEIVAGDDVSLAQLSNLSKLRRIQLPDEVIEGKSVTAATLESSANDRTGLENHSLKDARVWIFRKDHPYSTRLSQELLKSGWTALSNSSVPLVAIFIAPTSPDQAPHR